jgi:diaminopimelate epimerase
MIAFSKAHAYGNDFLYVTRDAAVNADLPALAREMCDRHTGIGADGLIVYDGSPSGASMRLFNADGGRAEVSGNGVRGLAALLLRDDARAEAVLTIQTDGGAKTLTRIGGAAPRQLFRAAMGLPLGLRQTAIPLDDGPIEGVVMNIGNPQCVVVGSLPSDDVFERLGAAVERHPMFPERTNVEFAMVEQPDLIRIRIWERGAGATMSSGTGSCAALVAGAAFGGARRDATVVAPGGAQRVEWRDDSVYLTGWAEVVCDGQWLRSLPRPT